MFSKQPKNITNPKKTRRIIIGKHIASWKSTFSAALEAILKSKKQKYTFSPIYCCLLLLNGKPYCWFWFNNDKFTLTVTILLILMIQDVTAVVIMFIISIILRITSVAATELTQLVIHGFEYRFWITVSQFVTCSWIYSWWNTLSASLIYA